MGGGALGGGALNSGAVGGGAFGGAAVEADDAELGDDAEAGGLSGWSPEGSGAPFRPRSTFAMYRLLSDLHRLADLILSEAVSWCVRRGDPELPVATLGLRPCLRRLFFMRRELRVLDTLNLLDRKEDVAGRSSQTTAWLERMVSAALDLISSSFSVE